LDIIGIEYLARQTGRDRPKYRQPDSIMTSQEIENADNPALAEHLTLKMHAYEKYEAKRSWKDRQSDW